MRSHKMVSSGSCGEVRAIFADKEPLASDVGKVQPRTSDPAPIVCAACTLATMTVSTHSLFGIDLYPLRFEIFTWIVVLLVGLVLADVRRSSFGHRMLATRNSEPAAAAARMHAARTKLQAFALSGFPAGLAGVMLAYELATLSIERFGAFDNVTLVAFPYIGGVGPLAGAVIAACMLDGSIIPALLDHWTGVSEWAPLAGGVLVVLTIILNPDDISIKAMRDAKNIAGRLVVLPKGAIGRATSCGRRVVMRILNATWLMCRPMHEWRGQLLLVPRCFKATADRLRGPIRAQKGTR